MNAISAPRKGQLVTLAIVCLALGVGLVVGALTSREPAQAVQEVRPAINVVAAVRSLSTLTTTEYRMERIVDLSERQEQLFGLVTANDRLVLVASATVLAGIDLSQISAADVQVSDDRRQVRLRLPRAAIITTAIDNQHTYVFSRDTDMLAARNETLESTARERAETMLRDAAIEAGILTNAERNAERAITQLLTSLGFDDVVVETSGQNGLAAE